MVPLSVAPSGMAFLTSERYPGWKGNLFVGTLRGESLMRLELDGSTVVLKEEKLLAHRPTRASATCARGRTATSMC